MKGYVAEQKVSNWQMNAWTLRIIGLSIIMVHAFICQSGHPPHHTELLSINCSSYSDRHYSDISKVY